MDVQKIPKNPLLLFSALCDLPDTKKYSKKNSEFFFQFFPHAGTVEENTWQFEVLLLFLSLRYAADLCLFFIKLHDYTINEKYSTGEYTVLLLPVLGFVVLFPQQLQVFGLREGATRLAAFAQTAQQLVLYLLQSLPLSQLLLRGGGGRKTLSEIYWSKSTPYWQPMVTHHWPSLRENWPMGRPSQLFFTVILNLIPVGFFRQF